MKTDLLPVPPPKKTLKEKTARLIEKGSSLPRKKKVATQEREERAIAGEKKSRGGSYGASDKGEKGWNAEEQERR